MTEFLGRAEGLHIAADRTGGVLTTAPRRKEHIRNATEADILLAAEAIFVFYPLGIDANLRRFPAAGLRRAG